MAKWMKFELKWLRPPSEAALEQFNREFRSKDHQSPWVDESGYDGAWRAPIVEVPMIKILLERAKLTAKFYLTEDRAHETQPPPTWEYACGNLSPRVAEVIGVLHRLEDTELLEVQDEIGALLEEHVATPTKLEQNAPFEEGGAKEAGDIIARAVVSPTTSLLPPSHRSKKSPELDAAIARAKRGAKNSKTETKRGKARSKVTRKN